MNGRGFRATLSLAIAALSMPDVGRGGAVAPAASSVDGNAPRVTPVETSGGDKVDQRARTRALSPAEALRAFVTHPGLRVELVAAEPNIVDPVAIRSEE